MKKIGQFNATDGRSFNLLMFGVVVQEGIDGTYLVPRGGNFLSNGMVDSHDKQLSDYLGDTFTQDGGLQQPALGLLPVPIGYKIAWAVDRQYRVVNYVFLKIDVPYNNDGGWFDSEVKAIAFKDSLGKVDVEQQGNKTIQIQVFQNCSNNDGVHFRLETLFPDTNTGSYDISVRRDGMDSDIEQIGHNEWVIRNHDTKRNGAFEVTVSRVDCKTLRYKGWSSTCNHDGQPTDCPDNQRNVTIGKVVKFGDVVIPQVNGNVNSDCSVAFYNEGVSSIGNGQFRIDSFPFHIHYQPNCNGGCHGWTEVYQETE